MTDLARDPAHRETLVVLREDLRKWGVENHDPLIAEMLADDVKPRPFAVVTTPKKLRQVEKPDEAKIETVRRERGSKMGPVRCPRN